MEDDFERMFLNMVNRMMQALSSGAMGVRISISPDGNVFVDPIRPRKRRIYVPFEVVDLGDSYLVTIDIRQLPKRATSFRVTPTGVNVETPKGERFIWFEEEVNPESVVMEERNGIVELTIKKGKGKGEKLIRIPD